MLRVEGLNDHTPAAALRAALHKIAPDLAYAHDPAKADLTVWPRRTDIRYGREAATPSAWYDLWWTHPAPGHLTPWDEEDPQLGIRHVRISRIRSVPPPPRIPAEQRLATAPPVTLDGLNERQIRMLGGPEQALKVLRGRQRIDVEHDHSTDAYDWAALAAQIVEIARGLTPPALDAAQRAQAAAARRLDAARRSLAAHLANARDAGHGAVADELEALLPEIAPSAAPDIHGRSHAKATVTA